MNHSWVRVQKYFFLTVGLIYKLLTICKHHITQSFSGADSMGFGASVEPRFNSKFHFYRNFWINLINLGHFVFSVQEVQF